nr:DUF2339 domain-containing protein [uncultured Pseudomonas sp.]
MQWIFMLIGLVLGALVLGAVSGEAMAGALLGVFVGLAVGQAIALQALRLQHEALRKSLAGLIERFNLGTGDLHERLLRLETGAPPQTDVAVEPHEEALAQPAVEQAAAAPVEPAAEPEWELELELPAASPGEPAVQSSPEPVLELPDVPHVPAAARVTEPPAPGLLERGITAARDWLLGGNTVLRVGLVLLFLGLAFLLRYASERVVVAIEFRYAGVALAAIALLALGWWLRQRRPAYALLMQGGGIAVLYLTVFAAMRLHPLLTPQVAMVLLVVVTLCSAVLAILQDARGLAAAAALGGFAAPILASSGGGSHVALFSYFALLNAGIFAIAWFKAWRELNLIGFVGTFGIGLAWGLRSYTPDLWLSTQAFLVLFFLMYVAIGLLFARRRLLEAPSEPENDSRQALLKWSARQTGYVDGSVLFGTPLVVFGLQYAVVQHLPFGPAFSALAMGLLYMALARVLVARAPGRAVLLMETCLALGVIFATLAIPLGLDARWTSAAWAVEGAGLYWLALRQQRLFARLFALLLQVAAAAAYLWDVRFGYDTLLTGSALGALMLGVALLFSFLQLRGAGDTVTDRERKLQPALAYGGLAFLYLLAPLCFGPYATAAAWAVAGAATLLAGLLLGARSLLTGALVVQALGGIIYLIFSDGLYQALVDETQRPLAHLAFWTPVLLALAGLFCAWRLHLAGRLNRADLRSMALQELSNVALCWFAAWWLLAAFSEIARFVPEPLQAHVFLLVAAISLASTTLFALHQRWPALAVLSLALVPLGFAAVPFAWHLDYHPLAELGWLAWPALFIVHLLMLRRVVGLAPEVLVRSSHVLGCWLLLGVVALELRFLFAALAENYNAWRWLGWVLVPCAFLLLMSVRRALPWPMAAYPREYRSYAALPIAVVLLGWFWLVNLLSDGSAEPLPYVPLINPLELGMLIVLFAVQHWARQGLAMLAIRAEHLRRATQDVMGASLFALLTMMVCRTAVHWGQVPFQADALVGSQLVQAGLSIVWTLIALGLTITGHIRVRRDLWMVGASLIGVVVVKLFFVDLGNSGSLERIISFIGVGVLLLVVGYFAPLPPRREAKEQVPA